MVFLRTATAALLTMLALVASASAATPEAPARPSGLHGFLLRADEPPRSAFPRTPAFAWNPYPGAASYEFQLATSNQFRENSFLYKAKDLKTPVAAPGLTLPWITGSPHALYARARAILADGTSSDWSDDFGFDVVPAVAPKPLASVPGVLRWTPSQGADAYEVWLIDAGKREMVFTNVLDERDFYTFHQSSRWIGTIRWRIRAVRAEHNKKDRINGIPITTYGPWSPIYSSTNPEIDPGPIRLGSTISDVSSNGDPTSTAHRLMPAFTWTGNQADDGTGAELYRVYIFTDRQCINRVFASGVVGSPAYSPRPYGGLSLPVANLSNARSVYLPDGTEPPGFTYDSEKIDPSEGKDMATPTTSLPAESGSSGTSDTGTLDWGDSDFGAPVDLWDVEWPQGGYYWTVIPVAAVSPDSLLTNVAAPGAPATATSLPATTTTGFAAGDQVVIGNVGNQENATVTDVSNGAFTFASALKFNHGAGEPILRTGGSLRYQDLEMAQDVCANGRVARFGKNSEPSLTSSGDLFASGLSPTGRLTSAVKTASFYKWPLVSWTPALGALAYEIQWSKSASPFDPKSGGKRLLGATSFVMPVEPGTWYYRVRGYDYSLPTGSQQMGWSDPAKITVTRPTFEIVPTTPAKTAKPTQSGKSSKKTTAKKK